MRYLFGIIAIVIILFASIFFITRRGDDPVPVGQRQVELTDYADTGATLVYHKSGPVIAEEEHRSVRITVTRNVRTVELISGYDGTVISSKTFSNTPAAFESFVYALSRAGFTAEQDAEYESVTGVCPNGNRSEYILRENNQEISRLWSTSCSNSDGSFAGDRSLVENLFEDQIIDYRDVVRGTGLR